MSKLDLDYFKKELLRERQELEKSLGKIAKKNPDNPEDWEPKAPKMNIQRADKNEAADKFEEFEERRQTEYHLEIRLQNVNKALKKLEDGTYGVCEVNIETDHELIEPNRLKANPAATTCLKHTK